MEIRTSATVRPGTYRLIDEVEYPKGQAITIRGDGITVDFTGVTLEGAPAEAEPDQRDGIAVRIDGSGVTIRGLRIKGYKVGLLARGVKNLKLINCTIEDMYRPRLRSGLERESFADWMSYHENDASEWLRFGAAAYLDDCDGAQVERLVTRNGQCGLMMTRCDDATIWNSDLSFMSAIGLGMYRCSSNRVMHNKIDWCVRGYSHGVYNRGQDSTGILLYEQSSRNVFAYNSVTHGGDGLFLWAGQDTMDTGEGGCNDNLFYGNDFSHAPTNGIEATFSRNDFVNNKVHECWHAVWGGYSFDSRFLYNDFAYNGETIAIEHGQNITIRENSFRRDHVALALWTNVADLNGGFSRFRTTRSRGHMIVGNTFSGITGAVLNLRQSDDVTFAGNTSTHTARVFDFAAERVSVRRELGYAPGTVRNLVIHSNDLSGPQERLPEDLEAAGHKPSFSPSPDRPGPMTMDLAGNSLIGEEWAIAPYIQRFESNWSPWPGKAATAARREIETWAPEPLEGGMDPFLSKGALRGRRFMLVTTWGPYDFRYPILWPRDVAGMKRATPVDPQRRTYEVLGPSGAWRLVKASGVVGEVPKQGTVPGVLQFTAKEGVEPVVELEYIGEQTVDYRGIVTPKGRPVRFGYPSPLIRLQPERRQRN